jgi:hypothetical protein
LLEIQPQFPSYPTLSLVTKLTGVCYLAQGTDYEAPNWATSTILQLLLPPSEVLSTSTFLWSGARFTSNVTYQYEVVPTIFVAAVPSGRFNVISITAFSDSS